MLKMSNKNDTYCGFSLHAGTVYGDFRGVKFATHGTTEKGQMFIYFYNNDTYTWTKKSVDPRFNEYAKAVEKKYGDVIRSRNANYKGSPKEAHDKKAAQVKADYRKAMREYAAKREEYNFFNSELKFRSTSFIGVR